MFCTLFGKTGKIKSTEFGRSLYDSWRQHFDSKSGLMIAGVMGGIIWFINSDHGILPATTAALKQMAYTVKMCESLAVKINNRTAALMLSMLVPSAITILATYTVHSLKRTPEPLNSTIPTMIGSPIFFIVLGMEKSKEVRKTMRNNMEYFVICLEAMLVSVFCPADQRFPGGRQDLYQCPQATSRCGFLSQRQCREHRGSSGTYCIKPRR